jgi:hydrogenase nickel incorporation protein HypB
MCTTCGCGGHDATIEGKPVYRRAHGHTLVDDLARAHPRDPHGHFHADGTWHSHAHAAPHAGALGAVHAPGTPEARIVQVEADLLAKNDALAAANRRLLAARGIFALNLVSSPGSGKTTLLVRTIETWGRRAPVVVIEGDQQTSFDADRIRATGAPAVQVNTGKGCHLDAMMVARALTELDPPPGSLAFIENVGNLVCPAAFDLGEAHKVVILSVTEGEDKPLKYPDMFRAADLMLVSKVDLAPYVSFDIAKAVDFARRVRPGLEVIEVSATTGAGFDHWLGWLERGLATARAGAGGEAAALRARVAELEAKLAALEGGTGA